jgi:hypothetical protein
MKEKKVCRLKKQYNHHIPQLFPISSLCKRIQIKNKHNVTYCHSRYQAKLSITDLNNDLYVIGGIKLMIENG